VEYDMSESDPYTPPAVWTWKQGHGGQFANINRPIAGPTHDKELPVGRHPLQLYSLGTPNGQKVTVMLEELLQAGHTGAEYDDVAARGVDHCPKRSDEALSVGVLTREMSIAVDDTVDRADDAG